MHSVHFVEIASLIVLGIFAAIEVRAGSARAQLPLAAALVAAAWLAEDTCIRLYGFYAYAPEWHLFLDQMPAMVATIWPFVILSNRRVVAGILGVGHRWLPLITALWVVWDACLMESIAVASGLWAWTQPGLFGVPLIGVLGWGFFTFAALLLWQHLPRGRRALTVVLAPALTHVLLLAAWWGGLRWTLRGPFPHEAVVAVGAAVAVALSALVIWRKTQIPLRIMGPRALAASVFGVLLAWHGADNQWLVAFAATFVLPYVLATDWRGGSRVA